MVQRQAVRFSGPPQTPLTRAVLGVLVGLYVLQVLLDRWLGLPLLETLAWWPPDTGRLAPWQPVTSFFLNGPGPLSAIISWVVIYFFLPTAERDLGHRGLAKLLVVAWLFAVVLSFPLLYLGLVGGASPYLGPYCFITALIVAFGLSRPQASILLFFVLPIRAGLIAWGTGLISFLYLLYTRELVSSVSFFGWVGAVLFMISDGSIRSLYWKARYQLLLRRRKAQGTGGSGSTKFRVYEGGKRDDDDDEPLYH